MAVERNQATSCSAHRRGPALGEVPNDRGEASVEALLEFPPRPVWAWDWPRGLDPHPEFSARGVVVKVNELMEETPQVFRIAAFEISEIQERARRKQAPHVQGRSRREYPG